MHAAEHMMHMHGRQETCFCHTLLLTDMFRSNNVRELNPFLISELYRAVIRNGDAVNLHDNIILLQHAVGGCKGINLIH